MAIKLKLRIPPLDLPMAWSALALVGIGLVTVYSATSIPGAHEGLWIKQLVWAVAAVVAAWLVAAIDYRAYDALAYPVYAISLVLLVLVLIMGSSAYGAKRWLEFGPLRFQPSELAKIATVLVLARHFDDPKIRLERFRCWFPAVLLTLVPFALVVKEPDLGTALSFPVILISLLYWAGMPLRQLLLWLSPGVNAVLFLATGSMWWFGVLFAGALVAVRPRLPTLLAVVLLNGAVSWGTPHLENSLHDYQKRRIETFLNPGHDPFGAGYQIIQSKIAIGSGGATGKGFLKGTQKGLAFLPMRHTDFIYSVVGEEFGLVGALTVVILYAVLILRGVRLAAVTRSRFASLMTIGLVTTLFFHVMVNILMTIGWAPVTGLPLPLLSYGGTALIVNGIQIGMLQGVALRRRDF